MLGKEGHLGFMPASTKFPKDDPKQHPGIGNQSANQGQVNNPELDEECKPTIRAISSADQAFQISKRQKDAFQRNRMGRNAQIMAQYGGRAPFDSKKLENSGQLWRNNFSTGNLSSVIDRAIPSFKGAISNSKYVTLSKLPEAMVDAERKSNSFREKTTRTIRAWGEWDDFVSRIINELLLIGYATPAWLDDDWRGRLFRSDEMFFPDGTPQISEMAQLFVVEQQLLWHEMAEILSNKKAAEAAGWNVENCVEIINAQGQGTGKPEKSSLEFEDKIREGAMMWSYDDEARSVNLFHVVVREYDGGVDLWTVDRLTGKLMRYQRNIAEAMPDVVRLMTIQCGNAKLYGSKGPGRLLVNISTAIERGRNLSADQMYLSGLLVLQVDEADYNSVQPTVRHPFITLPTTVQIATQSITYNAEATAAADQSLVEIEEQIIGAFIPSQDADEGSPSTKIADAQKILRENEVKQGILGRFFGQFAGIIETMQRRIFSPRNLREGWRAFQNKQDQIKRGVMVVPATVVDWLSGIEDLQESAVEVEAAYESKIADKNAVQCIVELLEDGLSLQEITLLALSPATETLDQENALNDQATTQWLIVASQTPFVDKKECLILGAEVSGVSQDRTKRVLLPDSVDPNIAAENTREQYMEWTQIVGGVPMDVSERDNHQIHIQTMVPLVTPLITALESEAHVTPQLVATAKLALAHAQQHVGMDRDSDPGTLDQAKQALQLWAGVIKKAEGWLQRIAAINQENGGGPNPNNMPPPVNGQPVSTLNNGAPSDQDIDLIRHGSEIALRTQEQQQEQQRINLESQKQQMDAQQQQHDQAMDLADKALEAAKLKIESFKAGASSPSEQIGSPQEPPTGLA